MNFKKLLITLALTGAASGCFAAQYKKFGQNDTAVLNNHLERYGLAGITAADTRLISGSKETPIFSVPTATANNLRQNSNLRQALGLAGTYGLKGIKTCVKYGALFGAVTCFSFASLTGHLGFSITAGMLGACNGAVKGLAFGIGTGFPIGAFYGLYRYCHYTGIESLTFGAPVAAPGHVWIRIKELDQELRGSGYQTIASTQADGGFQVVN